MILLISEIANVDDRNFLACLFKSVDDAHHLPEYLDGTIGIGIPGIRPATENGWYPRYPGTPKK